MPLDDVAEPRKRPLLQDAVSHPGTIKINVQGAFIVDDGGAPDLTGVEGDGYEFEHDRDIRLPNHTAVVSHVAVDVSMPGVHGLYTRERSATHAI